jgi:hypothetical protein
MSAFATLADPGSFLPPAFFPPPNLQNHAERLPEDRAHQHVAVLCVQDRETVVLGGGQTVVDGADPFDATEGLWEKREKWRP